MSRNIETIDSSLSQDPACASLLPKAEADGRYNNNLFGQFKGFTITPIPNQTKLVEPTKPAPAPPTIPTVAIKTNVKPVQKCSASLRNNLLSANFNDNPVCAPTLPPLNPGSTARPLISSPVLAATTCTSVELVAPKVPTRPAPEVPTRPAPAPPTVSPSASVPTKPQRPNSTPLTNVILPTTDPGERKPEKGSTLNRIASILRPSSGIMRSNFQASQRDDKSSTNSLPRSQHHKANKVLDKEILRNLEISHPIPQTEIEISTPVIPVTPAAVEVEKRNVVLRAQSMRDSKITPRPAIHTFGSMRQATTAPVKRPTSIPTSVRPTSPPPGPPTSVAHADKSVVESAIKIPGLPGYQNPPVKNVAQLKPLENTYDDCMNLIAESSLTRITEESPTNDNIYAVIEEPVPEKNRKNAELSEVSADNEYKLPKRVDTAPGTNSLESMGLLSEIVSEISNRNFDSIYSTSTLTRKKKEKEQAQEGEETSKNSDNMGSDSSLGGYMNASHYKTPGGNVYSNSTSGKFNSSSSTTSSGYLHPSAINVPQAHRQPSKGASDANDNPTKPVDKTKLNALNSNNPNLNDEMSKELGMKPPENPVGYKPFAPTKTRPTHLIHIKKDDQADGKAPIKPPLNRTKTPPNIAKSPTVKETPESKFARQSSDNTLKSTSKQHPDNNNSGSLSSSRSSKSSTTMDAIARQTQLNAAKSNSDLDKGDSRTTVNSVSVKNVPCSPKDSLSKFNSPDLVSSCSNSNQGGTKSPDVVGGNPKFSLSLKTVQKTPTLPKGAKTPTTPLKPLNVKATGPSEKKKSPTGNASIAKSLSPSSTKEATTVTAKLTSHLVSKVAAKTEAKSADGNGAKLNPVQRAASGKSNVASLQQKFEANKNTTGGIARTIPSANKKPVTVTTARVTEVSSGGGGGGAGGGVRK